MGNKKLRLKIQLQGSKSTVLEETVSLFSLERKVRFSLRRCNTDKFCIRKLADNEILRLYDRLAHLEELTWQQAVQLQREKCFSVEKRGTGNYTYLSKLFPEFSTFCHFRVNGLPTPFRVFAAQKEDLCCLLILDRRGEINHS